MRKDTHLCGTDNPSLPCQGFVSHFLLSRSPTLDSSSAPKNWIRAHDRSLSDITRREMASDATLLNHCSESELNFRRGIDRR